MQHSTPPPTADDQKRFDRLKEIGCIACRAWGFHSHADIHHLLSGNRRRGHAETIPLCRWHHVGVSDQQRDAKRMAIILGPSLARESKRFHERFGTDDELLAKVNELIAERENLA